MLPGIETYLQQKWYIVLCMAKLYSGGFLQAKTKVATYLLLKAILHKCI